ncbi:cupin domain-containing protein [Denitromonas halophila]|uniref:Cupin domain-containing protein n=1 Tax=Denitromonas halophila TaxID=1629404 RepID=A0A557QIG7_9RHOO|nr:cupin domain-containing protein [Denitromonas halophila]TVO52700.1 cupin domain-containing protein [Denitromonas halophila]
MDERPIRRALPGYRWDAVEVLAYKAEGAAPFKDVTRQRLFQADDLGCELRYFEVAAEGHSTLERHEHAHAVMVLRGRGACLVGERVQSIGPHDLVHIPAWTWHQFRANGTEPLGFLCMVNAERDRPQLPTAEDLAALKQDPKRAAFIRS